jgi:hypothetical protein
MSRMLGTWLPKWLRRPYGSPRWEWHYQPIPRRVYAEAFLGGPNGELPVDYKVMVLNGRAHFVSVFVREIGKALRRITFDRAWGLVPLHLPKYPGGPPDVVETSLHPPRPQRLDEMLLAAEALAEDFPFVRVDFYVVDEEIYFGELTFLPSAGYAPYCPSPTIGRSATCSMSGVTVRGRHSCCIGGDNRRAGSIALGSLRPTSAPPCP